jgi:hypothetical protein
VGLECDSHIQVVLMGATCAIREEILTCCVITFLQVVPRTISHGETSQIGLGVSNGFGQVSGQLSNDGSNIVGGGIGIVGVVCVIGCVLGGIGVVSCVSCGVLCGVCVVGRIGGCVCVGIGVIAVDCVVVIHVLSIGVIDGGGFCSID